MCQLDSFAFRSCHTYLALDELSVCDFVLAVPPQLLYTARYRLSKLACSLTSYLRNPVQTPDGNPGEHGLFHISCVPRLVQPLPSLQPHPSSVLLNDPDYGLLLLHTCHFLLLMLLCLKYCISCLPNPCQYLPGGELSCSAQTICKTGKIYQYLALALRATQKMYKLEEGVVIGLHFL